MQRDRALRITFAVLLSYPAWGCITAHRTHPGQPLRPSAHPYAAGIPVPLGFRLVDLSSEDWSSGPIRYLRHRYAGRADKYEVRNFYRDQMPLVKWTLGTDRCAGGRIVMGFQRRAESCTITIEDERHGLGHRVAVEIVIAPLER